MSERFEDFEGWRKRKDGVVVLYPGGFKPLTGGHLSLIRRYASLPEVKEVKLLVGPGIRNGIDQQTAITIANKFLENDPKITVEASKYPSPVLTAYKFVEEAEPGNYTLASSSKGEDWKRTKGFIDGHAPDGKYHDKLAPGVSVIALPLDVSPEIYSSRSDELNGEPISASILRADRMNGDRNNFGANYPEESPDAIDFVWNELEGKLEESNLSGYSRAYPYQYYKSLFNIVPLTEEDDEIEEKLEESQITGKVNKHMTHAEDLVTLGGIDGVDWVIKMFTNLYEHLKGFTPEDKVRLSVKIDGAPAVFAWSSFPGLGTSAKKSGLATKGLFAKNPKVMYTESEVDELYGDREDLAYKLKSFLKQLDSINIPDGEIWQGDFLFDDKSLQEVEIEGEKYYSFHPNTIYYVVPKEGELGEDIEKADVGIVWHTRYLGESLEEVQANYDADVDELTPSAKVFMTDPYVKSLAGKINFTKEESEAIESDIKYLSTFAIEIRDMPNYNSVVENKDLISLFSIYWNSLIKAQAEFDDPVGLLYEFIEWIQNRFLKEEEKRKSERGKEGVRKKAEEIILFIDDHQKMMIVIMDAILMIADLKQKFLSKLNRIGKFQTFLKMRDGGTRPTGQEGFAVSDMTGNVVKLVDRKEFSWSNFSPEVLKGWS